MRFIRSVFGFVIFLALILLFLSPVYAQPFYTDLYITIKDINSGEMITLMPVELNWYRVETGGTVNLTKYLDKRGTFSYRINPGEWRLQLYIDNRSTPEMDYSGETTYLISGEFVTTAETLYVVPIGSLELNVVDPEGKLVFGADVSFKCKSFRKTGQTDKFGGYKAENLPAGECKVSAVYNKLVGSVTVGVVQGETISTEIALSEAVTTPLENYIYYIIAGVVIIALLFLFYRLLYRRLKRKVKEEVVKGVRKRARKEDAKEQKKEEPKPQAQEGGLNPRARDIMKTLNEKEQKVVNFLITSNNKSTQATIRNETGIPKTTLARIFMTLEAKKVLKVETVGKLKKIELTDWFLGKD